MVNSSILHKAFKTFSTLVLLVGISMAGFFVQSLHVVHADTMSQDSVITCVGSMHNTDQAPCPSVKYQNVVATISSDSERLFFGQDFNNHILPTSTQYVLPIKLPYKVVKDFQLAKFEKRNSWITQLPRAHLS